MDKTNFQGWILSLISKSISSNRQYFYKITEQSDKIIVWLVGLSITSIALTISKESKLDSVIFNLTNYILIFGSLTVIFGVLYRIFLYIVQTLEIKILIAFEMYIEGYNNPPKVHFGRELSDEDTYEDIISFFKDDFDREIESIDTTTLNTDQIKDLRQKLIDFYLSHNNWANKKLEKEKNEVKNVLSTYLGYSNKKLDKIFNPKKFKFRITKLYWFCLYTTSTFFIISCMAFTSGMILILIEYLRKICS